MITLISQQSILVQYLDPGAGSLFFQLLLGGAAGLGLAAKHFWGHFKNRVSHIKFKK